MRLNLAEVALCLGCTEDKIIWEHVGGRDYTFASGPYTMHNPANTEEGKALPWLASPWGTVCPTGAEIDSRLVKSGDLFFCLKGERVDGHEYALQAAQEGAIAIIAERNPFWGIDAYEVGELTLPPVFLVANVEESLRRLARAHRDTTLAKVVGITGTAGKTSVKEVLAQVLAIRGATAKSGKNFNNQIGLPLSMLKASADMSFWVIEAGISLPHDMDILGAVLKPDVAVILNAGSGHVQGLGDKGVAHYKSKLLKYTQNDGVVVVCEDYPALVAEVNQQEQHLEAKGIAVRYFSSHNSRCGCFASYAGKVSGQLRGRYFVSIDSSTVDTEVPFIGDYGAENVAAIIAVAKSLGLRRDEVLEGLKQAHLPEQRFSCVQQGGFTIIDDSYNANPLSMGRMLEAASIIAQEENNPLVLVLGEMRELGDEAEAAHTELGKKIAASGCKALFWKGGFVEEVHAGLRMADYGGQFIPVVEPNDFIKPLDDLHLTSAVVLFKASHSIQIGQFLDVFCQCSLSGKEIDAL